MSDEIKEMLDLINELVKISPNKGSYGISHKKWKQLLDYITNLQQRSVDIGEYNTLVNKYNEVFKQNKNLKSQLKGTTHCYDEEEHKKLQQENDKLNRQIVIMEKYLELIYDLGFDYDGYSANEHLKKLIDELVHCASLGRACNTTEPIFTNMGKHYNILHEEVGGKEVRK